MTAREFIERHREITGNAVAALTDAYLVDAWPAMAAVLEGAEDKLLELRVFHSEEEHLLFRTDVGKSFTARMLRDVTEGDARRTVLMVNGEEDAVASGWESFDEEQYLDIDTKRSAELSGNEVYATGGGRYNLPLQNINGAKVKIRYYLDRYPETGQARVADWRVVEFMEGK